MKYYFTQFLLPVHFTCIKHVLNQLLPPPKHTGHGLILSVIPSEFMRKTFIDRMLFNDDILVYIDYWCFTNRTVLCLQWCSFCASVSSSCIFIVCFAFDKVLLKNPTTTTTTTNAAPDNGVSRIVSLSVCLSVCLSIYPSVFLSVTF